MRQITINIPAAGAQPGVTTVHASGKYFLLTALTAEIQVLTSNNDEYDFTKTGSGFGDDLSPKFGALTFYNTSGAVNTVTFFVSDSPIKLPDVNLTSSVNVTTQLTNILAQCAIEPDNQFQAVSGVGGAAVAFAVAGTYFRHATIIAQKTLGRTVNTGKVYIGPSAGNQPIALNPGDTWSLDADVGGKRDFGSWYVSADNAGDGVSVLYV